MSRTSVKTLSLTTTDAGSFDYSMDELRHFFRTKLGSWTESFELKCRMMKILVNQWYIEHMITIFNGSNNYQDGSSAQVGQVPRHNPTSKFGPSAPTPKFSGLWASSWRTYQVYSRPRKDCLTGHSERSIES